MNINSMTRLARVLTLLEGRTGNEISAACEGDITARAVAYLRGGRKMKRPPHLSTLRALETAAKVLAAKDQAA